MTGPARVQRVDWRKFGREECARLMQTRSPLEAVGLLVVIMAEGQNAPRATTLGAVARGAFDAYGEAVERQRQILANLPPVPDLDEQLQPELDVSLQPLPPMPHIPTRAEVRAGIEAGELCRMCERPHGGGSYCSECGTYQDDDPPSDPRRHAGNEFPEQIDG
jgi:hypothetical protein